MLFSLFAAVAQVGLRAAALLSPATQNVEPSGARVLRVRLLPFAAGLMNIAWMAGITIFVLVEKAFPAGEFVARLGGASLVSYGVWIIWIGSP